MNFQIHSFQDGVTWRHDSFPVPFDQLEPVGWGVAVVLYKLKKGAKKKKNL